MAEMSNVTALTNIGANLSEIVGVSTGGSLVLWCWIPLCGGLARYTKSMGLMGLGLVIVAVATPGIIDIAASVNELVGLAASLLLTIFNVGAGMYGIFFPSRIANERNHPNKDTINVLNWLFFLPFTFLIALIWSIRRIEPVPAQENSSG